MITLHRLGRKVILTMLTILTDLRILLWKFMSIFSILILIGINAGAEIVYDDKGLRDPLLPLISDEVNVVSGLSGVQTIDDIILEGYANDTNNKPMIIANGMVLYEGDQEKRVKVQQITERGVTFIINDKSYFKTFRQD
ncbi:MAG: hypothetical protein ACI9CF_001722 [Candidatus Omnitrophota bacterium]|jgi:hypothetical protein